MTKLQLSIIHEIYRAVEKVSDDIVLFGAIGSWGDTLTDEEVLEQLEAYNDGRIKSGPPVPLSQYEA